MLKGAYSYPFLNVSLLLKLTSTSNPLSLPIKLVYKYFVACIFLQIDCVSIFVAYCS